MNEFIVQYLPVVGILAFVVSLIVEVTKNLPFLKGIPTDLEVIVLSVVLTVVAFFAYMSYTSTSFMWYYVIGAIITGFLVAFVAMYGWTKLTELFDRFRR